MDDIQQRVISMADDLVIAKEALWRLKQASYFTDNEWIKLDFLIHKGKYKFTNGPPPRNLVNNSPIFMPTSIRGAPPSASVSVPRSVYDLDNIEANGAAEWEEPSTPDSATLVEATRALKPFVVASKARDAHSRTKAPAKRKARPARSAIESAGAAYNWSRAPATPAMRPAHPIICGAWADPGRECRYTDATCKYNHAFPEDHPSYFPSGSTATIQAQPEQHEPQEAGPTQKTEVCFWWATRRDCRYTDEECPKLHAEIPSTSNMNNSQHGRSETQQAVTGTWEEEDDRFPTQPSSPQQDLIDDETANLWW